LPGTPFPTRPRHPHPPDEGVFFFRLRADEIHEVYLTPDGGLSE
jgi:hypothetical protein